MGGVELFQLIGQNCAMNKQAQADPHLDNAIVPNRSSGHRHPIFSSLGANPSGNAGFEFGGGMFRERS